MYNDKLIKIKINGNLFTIKESHLHQHSDVNEYLIEALSKVDVQKLEGFEAQKLTINMQKVIGETACLEVNAEDEVFYAQRRGRKTMTALVKNKAAKPCNLITLVLAKKPNNSIKILTAYIGDQSEREPLDPSIKTEQEFELSKQSWATHALIDKSQRYYPNTVTKECPWDKFENRPQMELGNKNNVKSMMEKLRQPAESVVKNNLTN